MITATIIAVLVILFLLIVGIQSSRGQSSSTDLAETRGAEENNKYERERDSASPYQFPKSNTMIPLPSSGNPIRVGSQSSPGTFYIVNLNAMTCTCPDFVKRRSETAIGSLERACKHLRETLGQQPEIKGTVFQSALLAEYPNSAYWMDLSVPVIVGFTPRKQWINVFARSGQTKRKISYGRFGFSLDEWRWSYENKPYAPDVVEDLIADSFLKGGSDSRSEVQSAKNSREIQFDANLLSAVSKFYDLASSVVADNAVDMDEIRAMLKFFDDNRKQADRQPLKAMRELLLAVAQDGIISPLEQEAVLEVLKSIESVKR